MPRIDKKIVADQDRPSTLPRHFDKFCLQVENSAYRFAELFCDEYAGGYWEMYELSNGGLYMAPREDPGRTVRLSVQTNYFVGQVSEDALGIIVFLFIYSHLSSVPDYGDVFTRHFYSLRDYALDHDERIVIIGAID